MQLNPSGRLLPVCTVHTQEAAQQGLPKQNQASLGRQGSAASVDTQARARRGQLRAEAAQEWRGGLTKAEVRATRLLRFHLGHKQARRVCGAPVGAWVRCKKGALGFWSNGLACLQPAQPVLGSCSSSASRPLIAYLHPTGQTACASSA